VPYQSAAGTTVQLAAGTSGQVLKSNGAAAPSWLTSTNANTASAIVQRDASGNFSAGTITAALSGNATTATSATSATTATNLAGGSAGTVPYQSAAGTTVQLAAGTSGQVLKSNGAAAPSWVNGTISGISLGSNLATLTFGTYLTGTSYNGSTAVTLATNATNANTASTIVARDASGNFTAGTITASLTGNASGSAATFTSTSQNSQFNSIGVGTAASTTAGEIRATASVVAFYSSDIKFKENVRDIPNAATTVKAIGGKLFDWKDDYIEEHGGEDGYFVQKADFGVIAQDVQKHFPVAVRTRPDGSLAVDYEKLSALALAAIAEQEDRITKLEALVAKLIEG
jgi:hypothetical protein